MSLRRSLIGASCIIVQPLLLNVLSLPVTAYIIATLGPVDYGQWSVALALVASFGVLTNLGLRSFFIRGVARDPEMARVAFAEQLGLRILLAVGAGAVALTACALLGYPARVWECTTILVVGTVFSASAAVVSDLLTATEKLPVLSTINFVAGLSLSAASVVAMWFHTGPVGLAMAYLVGPVMTGVMSLAIVHRRMFPVRVTWSPRRCWTLLTEAKVLGFQLFIMNIGFNAESLMVPKMVGISPYGYFAAGSLLPKRLEAIPDGLNTAFFPVMSRGFRQGAREGAASVLKLHLLMVGACVAVAIGVCVLADPISRLLFPTQFELCRTIMRIAVWYVPAIGVANAMGYALNAAGRERDEARLAITGTVTSLALSAVLIAKFGLMGACVGLVAKGVIAFMVRLRCIISVLRQGEVASIPAVAVVDHAMEQGV